MPAPTTTRSTKSSRGTAIGLFDTTMTLSAVPRCTNRSATR
jgi:hypothetical protein